MRFEFGVVALNLSPRTLRTKESGCEQRLAREVATQAGNRTRGSIWLLQGSGFRV